MTLKLHNTLTRNLDTFTPMNDGKVTLYTCGPTVYNYLHVGNWAAYIYWDTLVRTLIADGYKVDRVMNITDVGHLVNDDEDTGEDKMQKGARREGKTAWEIAEFYAEDFLQGIEKLGLTMPEHVVRATDFIPQQLALIRTLQAKGYTYQIDDGIYFDTSKFPTYADFAGLDLAAQRAGARVEFNAEKRNPSDFALWKFTAKGEKRDMEWETPIDLLDSFSSSPSLLSPSQSHSTGDKVGPWRSARPDGDISSNERAETVRQARSAATLVSNDSATSTQGHLQPESKATSGPDFSPGAKPVLSGGGRRSDHTPAPEKSGRQDIPVMGFPGWHLECSAMAMNILGSTIDIHTGGIDHIPVHHTNEIAQSESASGQIFAHYWLHNNHIKSDGTKISKSLGNGYTLQDLEERGFSPLDYRMFVLQSQYSNEGNFTFENLAGAKNRLLHWRNIAALRWQTYDTLVDDDDKAVTLVAASGAIMEALNNNLNTPEALRVIDEAFARLDGKPLSGIRQHGLSQLLETIDETLGLQLATSTPDIADDLKQLILERQRARDEKNWEQSDTLRANLLEQGIVVRDTSSGSIWEYAS